MIVETKLSNLLDDLLQRARDGRLGDKVSDVAIATIIDGGAGSFTVVLMFDGEEQLRLFVKADGKPWCEPPVMGRLK
jgi:hypothetical protein